MEILKCPITHEIMEDPVVAYDGHTYERSAIEEWYRLEIDRCNSGVNSNFESNFFTIKSPMTGELLSSPHVLLLLPNYTLKKVIIEAKEEALKAELLKTRWEKKVEYLIGKEIRKYLNNKNNSVKYEDKNHQ